MSIQRIHPFRIGPYEIANNLVLAPMAGITDRPYRAICRALGAGLTVGEMVAANTALWGSSKSLRRLDFRGEPAPVVAQILGTDPHLMVEAAKRTLDLGAHIIDVNLGCPAKKVCKVAAGSALLRDERLVGRILEALVGALDAPVTVKLRTGWSPETRNAVRIAQIAHDAGIAAITLHGRTRACGYARPAEHETLHAVRAAVALPLIANGDIDSPASARRILDSTGADAIMLGRAARGRPWIFHEIAAALAPEPSPQRAPSASPPHTAPSTHGLVRDIIREHLDALYGFYGTRVGVRVARKHIAWYCRDRPGVATLRETINRIESADEQLAQVLAFLDQCPEQENMSA